ncbi:5299_t:CDS:1, partial [Cetraspora pellucida]
PHKKKTNNNATGSSASSTELDIPIEANDSLVNDVSTTVNGTIDNNNTSVTNNDEPRRHPIREPSFSDRLQLWKNTTDKRKSHADQDSNNSKGNEDGSNHSHEKSHSGEKPEKTALFWRKDKKDDKDDKKSTSLGVTVEENGKEHNAAIKKDKKAEKEERKREKKLKDKKLDKLPPSPNGIQASM